MGKTKYNVAYSLICNLLYYGIWFILYKTSVVVLSLEVIIIVFERGNITNLAISLINISIVQLLL